MSMQISKTFSYLLRHGAKEQGLDITEDGFVLLQDILRLPMLRGVTPVQVSKIVETSDKKRFEMKTDSDGAVWIRAVQGHTIKTVQEDGLMEVLTESTSPEFAYHGTYRRHQESIFSSGLSRMSRNHIHMSVQPKNNISGARRDVDLFLRIHVHKCMADGIPFYRSKNGVILTPGNSDGILEPKYFNVF